MQKMAVIGCGYWGKNLVRNFAELQTLHTICDTEEERLRFFRSQYPGIRTTRDFSDVLKCEEIRGIAIATPAETHFRLAREALRTGKDVLVEKPLSLRVAEGRELVDLASQNGRILMVGHVLEYHPAIIRLKEMVDGGDLGKINYIYSTRLNLGKFRTEENILWSFAPHDISVILLLLNEMPIQVSAHGGTYLNREIADVTMTTMTFASGVKSHIFVSWLHPYKEQKLVIVGDKKMAVFDDVAPKDKLLLFSHRIDWIERVPVPRKEDAEIIPIEMTEPLREECKHFLDSIEQRQQPKTDGADGLRVLEILEGCQRSLEKSGATIPLGKEGFFAHPTASIDEGCEIGEGTRIWHHTHITGGARIGKGCSIGQNVYIGKGVRIGNHVKIQNNVSVFEGVTLEDYVFCGPSMVFTNVFNPRSHISRKHEFRPTLVKRGATLGANATVICGHTIGSYAFVGAGSVVTSDVPPYALVYGNPARHKGWVCECGVPMDFEKGLAICQACGKTYRKDRTKISPI
jgi:UDP-2-acetamido-3-amino-2,3-dideoxy-glucuronate N-acetyltransferase